MILRSIIIDDEQKGIDALKILIERFLDDVKVVAETTDPKHAIGLLESYRPEIVFLDINMPEMNGFDLLEKLDSQDFNLVFTTAHQQYGLKALKNNAVDYLLKPVDYEDLCFTINKIKSQMTANASFKPLDDDMLLSVMQQASKSRLLIHTKTGIESIDTDDISFFESRSNYTSIHLTNSRSILTSKTLKDFELQLCNGTAGFMRVHHSFIINFQKVLRFVKVSEAIVMADGCVIPLSKSRKPAFFKLLDIKAS
jgi:two-component system LytT family response regulator